MKMKRHMSVGFAVFVVGLVMLMDALWLLANRGGYNRLVTAVQGRPIAINMVGALVAYACVLGLLFFFAFPVARANITKRGPMGAALWGGGLLGILAYGVFNGTNMGIFGGWRGGMVLADMLWGGFLFTVATLAYVLHLTTAAWPWS